MFFAMRGGKTGVKDDATGTGGKGDLLTFIAADRVNPEHP